MTKRTKAAKKAARLEPMFSNRVRFNWGYHDAAQAVREGWACPERNFGFGPALTVQKATDVLNAHQDRHYALGWWEGYNAALAGESTESSEGAWQRCCFGGQVEE